MNEITNDDLKWLLDLLAEQQLAEIEVAIGEERVVLKAAGMVPAVGTAPVVAAPAVSPAPADAAASQALAIPDGCEALRSPMAGIFYRQPSPEKPPYVEPGDEVHVGDTIGLVEAMKLFNEVTSHVHGRVVKFIPENAEHVEADAPLVLIEPFHSHL